MRRRLLKPYNFKLRLFILGIIVLLGWMYYPTLVFNSPPLTFKVEGLLDSKINFRDAGLSINGCAGTFLIPEKRILRASGFFSGWSCDKVGNPDVIYSLNYSDDENRRYYCRGASQYPLGLNIGINFQSKEMSDIEFLSVWDQNPDQVRSVCSFLLEGLLQLKNEKKILLHCEAGRDRTGAMVALMAAYMLEDQGPLTDEAIKAIECDYRKSRSLKSEKYGRIQRLLEALRHEGGVQKFIRSRCAGWPNDI
jgi:hypothetical protein